MVMFSFGWSLLFLFSLYFTTVLTDAFFSRFTETPAALSFVRSSLLLITQDLDRRLNSARAL